MNGSFEESRDAFQRLFINACKGKPWVIKKAIMVPKAGTDGEEEAAGFVGTSRPSPNGLLFGYYLRDDFWGQGYATAAAKAFLKEYWSEPRMAPKDDIFQDYDERGDPIESKSTEGGDQVVEIKYLTAEVDYDNVGSMRVAEKCGGKVIGSFDAELFRFNGWRKHAVWKLEKPNVS